MQLWILAECVDLVATAVYHLICMPSVQHTCTAARVQQATSQIFKWLEQLQLAAFHWGSWFVCDRCRAASSSVTPLQHVHSLWGNVHICKRTDINTPFLIPDNLKSSCVRLAFQTFVSCQFYLQDCVLTSQDFHHPTLVLLSSNRKQ